MDLNIYIYMYVSVIGYIVLVGVLFEKFYSCGIGDCYFSSFLLFRMMCVRYRIDIFEKISISLWILGLGILSSLRLLKVV